MIQSREPSLFVCTRAFTLIELSVVLIMAGLIAAFGLKMFESSGRAECYTATKTQLELVRASIERFADANDRFPLPARRFVGVDNKNYGREIDPVKLFDADTTNDTELADLNTVPHPTNGAIAVFGALPFSTLGLTQDKGVDCWGNKLTYVVTKDLTNPNRNAQGDTNLTNQDIDTKGAIIVRLDNAVTLMDQVGYAIISHGEDQLGAAKANFDDPSATTLGQRKWCPADGALRSVNCLASSSTLMAAQFNNGKDAGNNYFDDVIIYRGKPWRTPVSECECPPGAAPWQNLFTVSPNGPACNPNP